VARGDELAGAAAAARGTLADPVTGLGRLRANADAETLTPT